MSEATHVPATEDSNRYRRLADDADACAMQVDGGAREAYVLMAEQWRELARAVEKAALA